MKKRIFALILAATMTLGMSMTAFAAKNYTLVDTVTTRAEARADQEHELTVKGSSEHSLAVYQIFDMTVYNNAEVVVNGWGSGIDTDGQSALATLLNTENDAAKVAEAFKVTDSQTAEEIDNFIKTASKYLGTSNTDLTKLSSGYYLLADTVNAGTDDAKTVYSLQLVLDDTTVETKIDAVKIDKTVDDVNDSDVNDADEQDGQESADYDIGDYVPFTLTGTISDDFNNTDTKGKPLAYPYAFIDKFEDGGALELDADSIEVYVDGVLLEKYTDTVKKFTYDVTATDEYTFKVSIADLHSVEGVTSSSTIEVKFQAKLTENAKVGADGNKNDAKIVYGNGGETQWDTVKVYTYGIKFTKVDENGANLTGAEFKLYKYYTTEQNITDTLDSKYYEALSKEHYDAVTSESFVAQYYFAGDLDKADNGYDFSIDGLDAGYYVLVESTVPDGYNEMTAIEFEIDATHDENTLDLSSTLSGFSTETDTDNKATGYVSGKIENRKGTILPSTGGIGTTIFYVIGGLLVVGAGVVLFTRKKMSIEE